MLGLILLQNLTKNVTQFLFSPLKALKSTFLVLQSCFTIIENCPRSSCLLGIYFSGSQPFCVCFPSSTLIQMYHCYQLFDASLETRDPWFYFKTLNGCLVDLKSKLLKLLTTRQIDSEENSSRCQVKKLLSSKVANNDKYQNSINFWNLLIWSCDSVLWV